jgi:CheY-like chemotaxis protein
MAHILIVEDEDHIRFLIRKVMESVGHTTVEARDGVHALELLNNQIQSFELIILDIRMPNMNGIEFLTELRKQAYYLPVIILSAHWDQIPQAMSSGASGHLIKPFSRQKLLDLVNSLVKTPSS